MTDITSPIAARLTVGYLDLRSVADRVIERLRDDRGADESTSRLLWIVTGVAIAIAATGVAVTVYNNVSTSVNQTPVAPTP